MDDKSFAGEALSWLESCICDARDRVIELAEELAEETGAERVTIEHVREAWQLFIEDEYDSFV